MKIEKPDRNLKSILKGTMMATTPAQQLLAAYKESHSEPSKDIDDLMNNRSKAIISSDVVENIHNVQKNSQQCMGTKVQTT